MMRNLKVLGLALVAMLAMSSVAASMASADTLTGEKYPVQLTGDQDGGTDIFTTTAGTVSCKKATYVGSIAGPTKEASATPTYSECTAFGFPATVDVNGCSYKFTQTTAGAGATTSKVDIVCPEGQSIKVTANPAPLTPKCTVTVPPQAGLAHVNWVNIGAGTTREITGTISISTLTYTHTAGTGLGACTSGHAANGSYAGKARVTGEVPSTNTHIGIFFS